MKTLNGLARAFDVIINEARERPEFAERLERALSHGESGGEKEALPPKARRSRRRGRHRRPPAVVDPLELFAESEDRLRASLSDLSLDQLKDIVAEHGMDARKLAMRWKNRDRLEELIVTTVRSRLSKGSAFRRDPDGADVQ